MNARHKICSLDVTPDGRDVFTASYPLDRIREVAKQNRLLSIELEPTLSCNYHCPYCYSFKEETPENELSYEELVDIVTQAKELGAEKVVLLGGEPLLHPRIMDLVEFIRSREMMVELFSNGALLTAEIAKRLFEMKVKLVLKLNSFKSDVQAELTGEEDALEKSMTAIQNAIDAGYTRGNELLAVSSMICRSNLSEIETLWRYLRERNITPYFEIITPQGKAVENDHLQPSSQELQDIFHNLSDIDKAYGRDWSPRPPLVGDRCLRHLYSCLITSVGTVFPCVGVDVSVGNIRETRLDDIIRDSEIIQDLRNHLDTIKDPCGSCDLAAECYGCRGAAYQLTGDWLAADPLCWRNEPHKEAIQSLPCQASHLIPHRPPMRMIDTLNAIGEKTVVGTFTVTPDNRFTDSEGTLAESTYIEMMAQVMAAGNTFKEGVCTEGMLIGVKNFNVRRRAVVGNCLRVVSTKTASFEHWVIVQGNVFLDDCLVAEAELKIWLGLPEAE